jgi:hypothetical protein
MSTQRQKGKGNITPVSNNVNITLSSKIVGGFLSLYDPVPMKEPVLPYIDDMGVIERTAVVVGYNFENLIYSLSPRGGLVAWWKLLVKVVFFTIPTFLTISLLLSMVVYIMGKFVIITDILRLIMQNIIWILIGAIIAVLLITVLIRLLVGVIRLLGRL